MNLHKLEWMWQQLELTGGFSVDPCTGEPAPDHGYMVSVQGHEEAYPEFLFTVGKDAILAAYVQRHREALTFCAGHRVRWLGAWKHAGKVYLDTSFYTVSLQVALRKAKEWDQIAIYDLENKKEIKV